MNMIYNGVVREMSQAEIDALEQMRKESEESIPT